MGVVPVIIQIIGFLIAGFLIGGSDRRTLYQKVKIVGICALILPGTIVIWQSAFDYEGYMFFLLEFIQLTFFGLLGIAAGQMKQKWELIKESNQDE